MPEFIQNIEFVWPWVFLLLPLPLLLVLWNKNTSTKPQVDSEGGSLHPDKAALHDSQSGVPVGQFLDQVLSDHADNSKRFKLASLLLWICWLFLLSSLARPVMLSEETLQPASGRALSLVVDLSGSMEREDFVLNDTKTDRLTAVKRIAADFLRQRQGDRVSLILYGDSAFIAAPLSFDLNAIANMLASSGIGMAGRATAIGDALGLAISSLRNDDSPHKAIVLLSDGTNNAGTAEPESAAALASSLGIRIHSIGLGSELPDNQSRSSFTTAPSADLDEAALKAIAESAGGQFFRATTTDELGAVYSEIHELEGGNSTAPPLVLKSDIRNLPLSGLLISTLLLATIQWLGGTRSQNKRVSLRQSPTAVANGLVNGLAKKVSDRTL